MYQHPICNVPPTIEYNYTGSWKETSQVEGMIIYHAKDAYFIRLFNEVGVRNSSFKIPFYHCIVNISLLDYWLSFPFYATDT